MMGRNARVRKAKSAAKKTPTVPHKFPCDAFVQEQARAAVRDGVLQVDKDGYHEVCKCCLPSFLKKHGYLDEGETDDQG